MPTEQDQILSEETLKLVEAREAHKHYHDPDYRFVPVYEDERDALCQTVRVLRAENDKLKASRRVHELDNHHNALACGYCAGPLRDELTRSQSRLSEAESRYLEQLEANQMVQVDAGDTIDSFRTRVINLCKEKAQIERDRHPHTAGTDPYLRGSIDTWNEAAEAIENLDHKGAL